MSNSSDVSFLTRTMAFCCTRALCLYCQLLISWHPEFIMLDFIKVSSSKSMKHAKTSALTFRDRWIRTVCLWFSRRVFYIRMWLIKLIILWSVFEERDECRQQPFVWNNHHLSIFFSKLTPSGSVSWSAHPFSLSTFGISFFRLLFGLPGFLLHSLGLATFLVHLLSSVLMRCLALSILILLSVYQCRLLLFSGGSIRWSFDHACPADFASFVFVQFLGCHF